MLGKIKNIFEKIFFVIGVVASILGIYSFISGKSYIPTKQLTIYEYDVVSLFSKNLNKEELDILYKNEKVNNLYMLKYTIKNNGKDEIIPSDYIENISLSGNFGKIIECNIIDSSNSYIKKSITEQTILDDNLITFPNILLNSNDYYTITIIITEIPTDISFNTVISGISNINYNTERKLLEENTKLKAFSHFIIIMSFIVCIPIVFSMFYTIYIEKYRKAKFKKIFHCSDKDADCFANYYYKKMKKLKKENQNEKIKELDNQIKEVIMSNCCESNNKG
jgi:hypothetical protein